MWARKIASRLKNLRDELVRIVRNFASLLSKKVVGVVFSGANKGFRNVTKEIIFVEGLGMGMTRLVFLYFLLS